MKLLLAIISLLALLVTVTATTTDYCASTLCSGRVHIGCNNNGDFAEGCPAGQTTMIEMTTSLQSKIVESHNTKRNTIASGELPGFSSAERMGTMQWNEELALLASYNVKTCKFAHDTCRNTNTFKYSGQNLAKFWWSGGSYTDEGIIMKQIDNWWNEYVDTTIAQIESYPTSANKTIGHFTVMTAESNIALGCAAIRFPDGKMSSLTFACNYATTNIINKAMYNAGEVASKCTSGRHTTYRGLCSATEVY